MKFKYYSISEVTFLEAIFEEDDIFTSQRLEGVGVNITNKNPLVYFTGKYENIHPDILGAICLAIFYPFIGKKCEFPLSVSSRLATTINRPIFTKTKKIDIINIDHRLEQYSGNGKYVLAYGGGIDSTAARAIFPDALSVHEASIRLGEVIPDRTNEVVKKIQDRGECVFSNQRYISDPGGWHVWIASAVTAVLVAAKINASYVLTGANLGSSFLQNGKGFFDRDNAVKYHGVSGNYWEQVFYDIGLPVFSPIMGMSEVLNMKVCIESGLMSDVNYCTLNYGGPCNVCPKCFRRACIFEYLSGTSVDFSNYNNKAVLALLQKKPTYFGQEYSALLNEGWVPPEFVKPSLEHLYRGTNFPFFHYQGSYGFFPEGIRDLVIERLNVFSSPMCGSDVESMKSWS